MAGPAIVSVRKIWDRGTHNAFTDLARFRDRWFCVFREAEEHAGGMGEVRVLGSADGAKWESVALLSEQGVDLRDPKLSLMPDGRLMLLMGGTHARARSGGVRQPRVAFSENGRTWTRPRPIMDDGDWLWRVTWLGHRCLGVSYRLRTARTWDISLKESSNGVDYETICRLNVPGKPNETTLRFRPDGQALALVRREGGDKAGWIGMSRPPYAEWTWRSAGIRVGGPNFLALPDGSLWAAHRRHARAGPVTVVSRMTWTGLHPVLTLPSGGDCSYPGLVWHRGLLWVSYYSSHEGKASIYVAKVRP